MRFEILYGRSGCAKTYEAMERIKKHIANDEKCVMIVPEQFCYRVEKLFVSSLGAISSQAGEVLTFTRLASRIFSQKNGAYKMPLSAAGKSMLMYRAMLSQKNKLKSYSLAAEKTGFVQRLMDIVSEFKRYGISPGDLKKAAENIDKPALAAKMNDLSLIYEKYDELFLDDYSDFEDNLYLAASMLEDSDYLKDTYIFIDEFTDFLPQHYKMIEVLSKRAKGIVVCLCADKTLDKNSLFAPSVKTYFKLKAMCEENSISFASTYLENNFLHKENEELLHLEKNFLKIDAKSYDDTTKNIEIFEALNTYSEIENAAKKILSLVRDNGVRWRDITVCCGDEQMYYDNIKMIFSRYSIPCFISEKSEISSHPLVLTILSAIDVIVSGFSYESVFTYLKTGFANIDAHECDLLENYVLATGVTKRAWLDDKVWSYSDAINEEEAVENIQIDQIRRRVCAPLKKLGDNIGSRHSVAHSCEAIYEFICSLCMEEKTRALVDEFKASGELVSANMYTRIWNSILNVLDQIVLTTGEKKIGREQLMNLLETGFLNEQMGIIPQSADSVSVVNVPNARVQSCDYMFALGTNTGGFVGATRDEGIFTDIEREAAEHAGLLIAPTKRTSLFDSDYLIYKAVTRPKKKLFISYAVSKMDTTSLPVSQVCRNIKSIFPNVCMSDDLVKDKNEKPFLGSVSSTFSALAQSINDEYDDSDGFLRQLYNWYKSNDEYKDKIHSLEKLISYSNEAATLSPDKVERLYPRGINATASRLERYSKCPFSYFVEYTLKAKERKILKIGAPDIGNIMHAVLERFEKQIKKDNIAWNQIDEKYVESVVSVIVDEIGEKVFYGSTLENKSTRYLLLRLKRNLIRCVKLLVMHIASGNFEPVGSEIEFGDDGQLRAVVIDLTSGKKLKIHGIIDRLDKCEAKDGTYYRVVDYKSGSKKFSLENIYNKLDLQLVVYLKAALGEDENAKPAGMLYFNIREPMINATSKMTKEESDTAVKDSMKLDGLVLNDIEVIRDMDKNFDGESQFLPIKLNSDGEIRINSSVATMSQFKVLFEYVKKTLGQIGDSIASGNIDIMPYKDGENSPCVYCAYKAVCKFDASQSKKGYRMCQKAPVSKVWEMFSEGRR